MTARLWAVFLKELRDALRDRRAMLSMLIFPLVAPLVTALVMSQAVEQSTSVAEMELPVVGAEQAPALMAQFAQHQIKAVTAPADPIAAVSTQQVGMVLIIDAEFASAYRASKDARVTLLFDASRNGQLAPLRRVEQVLQAHNQRVGALRLLAHGIDPGVREPMKIQRVDVSTSRARGALFLNSVAMFVLLAAFIGGMYTAIDVTTGERERGSLEPLLITPVLRRTLVLGKWLVTASLAFATVLITLTALVITLRLVPAERLGMSVELSALDALSVLSLMLPLCLLTTATQLLVASFARTLKEAQTYLSLLLFLPMIPGVALALKPLPSQPWTAFVPILGQQVLLNGSMRGEPIRPLQALTAALVCIVLTALTLQLVAWLFRREQVIYGR